MGYNTSAFFAPDIRYSMSRSSSGTVREFKTMVRNLHEPGSNDSGRRVKPYGRGR